MSTTVASVAKHFPSAQNGFTTTLASSISSGAATVPLNSVAGYSNGEVAVFIVDPTDASKKQTFTGTIDTAGVQVTGVVWTAGTNVAHSAGATVVDYAAATHISMMTKGLLVEHLQTGIHALTSSATITSSKVITSLNDTNGNEIFKVGATASAVNEVTLTNAATGNSPDISATGGDSNIGLTLTPKGTGGVGFTKRADGWVTGLTAPSVVSASGNRLYSLTISGTDYTDRLSPGMRLKLTRTVTAPTQCTSLNGTNQYYSKSSPNKLTFTDDFVVSAWVKLSSLNAGTTAIASRWNGTSGWCFRLLANGQPELVGFNAGAANYSYVASYATIPIGKWVHIAAQLDMSTFTATTTTSYVMIDGINAAATVVRSGTNPTALIQAGNLEIGGENGGTLNFPGKIAQVAIYNAKVTQATILASMNQTLTGSETSLASAYSFNNSIADLNTSTPNDLTAQNSAVATNADSPFSGGSGGTTEYAYITGISYSSDTTITVSCPSGYLLPTSGGMSAMSYSTDSSPVGWTNLNYNPYQFMVIRSAAWTDGNGTYAKVPYETKVFDTNSNFDTTNNRYVAPVSGFYQFNYGCNFSITAGNFAIIQLYRNGISVGVGQQTLVSASNTHTQSASEVVYMSANDYVEAWHLGTGGNGGTGLSTHFSGFLINQT